MVQRPYTLKNLKTMNDQLRDLVVSQINHAMDHIVDFLCKIKKYPQEIEYTGELIQLWLENDGRKNDIEYRKCFSLFKLVEICDYWLNSPLLAPQRLDDLWILEDSKYFDLFSSQFTKKPKTERAVE